MQRSLEIPQILYPVASISLTRRERFSWNLVERWQRTQRTYRHWLEAGISVERVSKQIPPVFRPSRITLHRHKYNHRSLWHSYICTRALLHAGAIKYEAIRRWRFNTAQVSPWGTMYTQPCASYTTTGLFHVFNRPDYNSAVAAFRRLRLRAIHFAPLRETSSYHFISKLRARSPVEYVTRNVSSVRRIAHRGLSMD